MIKLDTFEQWYTYRGMLEGYPTARFNDLYLESAEEKAREIRGPLTKPYPVVPERRSYQSQPDDMDDYIAHQRDHGLGRRELPEFLPSIPCIAQFTSFDSDLDETGMTVVWYQDNFALPID